ncbi:2-polyprenyl-6-methoxyphenol hydroxylase [Labilithrix luteola]|uniref:2-polyprenyl-6-methoxyphenol hydroxylase n=1 Tax=Labilithrix luteola TaxID=1391654 RepID=A0A0K1Q3I0_9BACT|nr:FAD-dependent oxidoreductase [Labilithrix luteola]AKV00319.1 2-polyprenyl-6-methoxyphenol hydroxylase [Labilithrix luteola]
MDIAILGAGIAGASAALALHQQGHRVRLYERRSTLTTLGAGIVLWPNASFVLEQLGLLPEVAAVSGRPRAMLRLDPTGAPLGGVDVVALNALMGHGSHSILRRDLHAILLEHLASQGIAITLGRRAEGIESLGDGHAMVRFADGARISADLVIGADGRNHSVARRYVVGDSTPVYQGFVNWVGVAESTSALVDEVAIYDYWGVGERFGIVAVTPHKVYWAGAKAVDIDEATSQDSPKPLLEKMFEAWAEPIRDVLRATPGDTIRTIAVHDLDPIPVWHRDNVVLIGDAAHAPLPTSGQGACQALEDAWHLARILAEHEELASALTAFTHLRSAKTAAITEGGRAFAQSLFTTDEGRCHARNESAKAADPIAAVQGMAKLWGAELPLNGVPSQRRIEP